MKRNIAAALALVAATFLAGCGTYHRRGLDPAQARQIEQAVVRHEARLPSELEDRILALNATNVTAEDVRDLLSHAPAPRVINIHGGVVGVKSHMVSFSQFLIGMGYPGSSLTNPGDGSYTFSCYERSEKIAGVIAWFYESDGLRPMMVGHSQGGMQAVKVLYRLAEKSSSGVHVWNPLTWKREERCDIVDPLTREKRPVTGLQLSYVTSVGAGGFTRFMPNQWDMSLRLRTIPDSVEEFTGFCKEIDLLGGDLFGFGPANEFKSGGTAVVRNVWLPAGYNHVTIPDTNHLLKSQQIRDWINRYRPAPAPVITPKLEVKFDADSSHILWAADVWYSIKKHWVLELQRLIRAQRAHNHDH